MASQPKLDEMRLHERRERVFLGMAGLFLGVLAMLNIIGITRFVSIGPFDVAVGVLPYPITFLCTDFISEFYGRRRANFVVFLGLVLNVFVILVLWVGHLLPSIDFKTDLQRLNVVKQETVYKDLDTKTPLIDPNTNLPLKQPVIEDTDGRKHVVRSVRMDPVRDSKSGELILDPQSGEPVLVPVDATTGIPLVKEEELYTRIFLSAQGAVFASMIAYLIAQFCDVFLFHFWKRLTGGKHLWLRNNGSTIVSQLVDTIAVVLITFWAAIKTGEMTVQLVLKIMWGMYAFKLLVAVLDTIPFYFGVFAMKRYLQIDPTRIDKANGGLSTGN